MSISFFVCKDIFMKRCKKCNEEKPIEEFHIDRNNKDGYKNICKKCRSRKETSFNNHKKLDYLINLSMKRSIKKERSGYIWERIININLYELKKHLESQFDENMNWDNYCNYWVIDKIIPTSMYNYNEIRSGEFQKAWSLKNIRPLSKDKFNRKKKSIILEEIKEYNLYDILPAGLLGEVI